MLVPIISGVKWIRNDYSISHETNHHLYLRKLSTAQYILPIKFQFDLNDLKMFHFDLEMFHFDTFKAFIDFDNLAFGDIAKP